MAKHQEHSSSGEPLSALRKGARGVVIEILDDDRAEISDIRGATIGRRLIELGFVPGERIEVVAAVQPGGDPIAVRVGNSLFALRRREAGAVRVALDTPTSVAGARG